MHNVRLAQFEGPLDLLLYFVQRDELDIRDIPIARILDEFLATVALMQELDLDGVADFLYMASLLMSIKARMLLPRPTSGEEAAEDPRQELVMRLLEYMRYKEAAAHLEEARRMRQQIFVRPGMQRRVEESLEVPPFFQLLEVFRHLLQRMAPPEEPPHAVAPEPYTMEGQMAFLLEHLREGTRRKFSELVGGRSRPFIITTFLALLELLRQGRLALALDAHQQDFYLWSVS